MRSRALARLVALCVIASIVLAAVALGSGCSGSSTADQPGLPSSSDPKLDAGRVLVESKCKMCHTLDRIKSANHDAAGWESTVSRMRSHGAVLSDDEAQSIVNYLSSR